MEATEREVKEKSNKKFSQVEILLSFNWNKNCFINYV